MNKSPNHTKMIYFIFLTYRPNTAVSNRALAYYHAIDKLGTPIKVIYLLPDESRSKIEPHFRNIHFHYCWDRFYFNNKFLKYFSYLFYLHWFAHQLNEGDKVYIYSLNDIIRRIVRKKGVDFYYEITECPEVSLTTTELGKPTLKKHLDFCNRLKGLIVISNQLKNYYIQKGIDERIIHVVNIIVDPNRFAGLNKELNREKYIAYCGTASNNKDGVDILIKSFAAVVAKYPDIKLYIIGRIPSSEEKRGNLRLINELGIQDNVFLTGAITAEEMPQMLKNAAVLALARPDNIQAQYGFPTKLGEYLLSENPVVVTAVGDIPRFLRDKENALIAPPNDINAFSDKLVWAIEHPDEGRIIGSNGKQVALQSFNDYLETKKLMNIIIS